MNTTQYAVYTNECILAVADTAEQAMSESGLTGDLVNLEPNGRYGDAVVVVVDLRDCLRIHPDSERNAADHGALRRCTAELAAQVVARGGDVAFRIGDDGALTTAD